METHHAVFGAFRTSKEADFAAGVLTRAGFKPWSISVLAPTKNNVNSFRHQLKTTVPIGATVGAIIGFIGGAIFIRQAFNWTEDLVVFIVLGSLITSLLGAACGALVGIGTPKRVRYRYLGYVKGGNVLMSVDADDKNRILRAQKILEATGAQDISDEDADKTWNVVLNP